jgi:hypothetical protein
MPVSISNLKATFANSASSYSALSVDVTDLASAYGSKLLDLKVNGVTKFSVDKNGYPSSNIAIFDSTARSLATDAATIGSAAYNKANSSNTIASSAFNKANAANVLAQSAYDIASGYSPVIITSAYTQANTAYDRGNLALQAAQGAFAKSNAGYTLTNLNINEIDLVDVAGNLRGYLYTTSANNIKLLSNTGSNVIVASPNNMEFLANTYYFYTINEDYSVLTITDTGQIAITNTGYSIPSVPTRLFVYGYPGESTLVASDFGTGSQIIVSDVGSGRNFYDANTHYFRSNTGSEFMRIQPEGRIGINGTSGDARLRIAPPAGQASLQAVGINGTQVYIDYLGTGQSYYDANTHYFRSNNSVERMRITPLGNVAIRGAGGNYHLDVNGTINASNILINGAKISAGGGVGAATNNNILFNDSDSANGSNSLLFFKSNNTLAAANISVIGTSTFITANSINVTNLFVLGAITYSVANNIIINKTEVNSIVTIANTNGTAATSNIIDTFLMTDYRSAHYHVTMNAGSNWYTTQYSLIHDGSSTVAGTQYGNLIIGTSVGNLSVSIFGTSNIRLNLVSTQACTTVRIFRTATAT